MLTDAVAVYSEWGRPTQRPIRRVSAEALAAMPFAAALIQLPASYFLARHGHRKRLFLIAGIGHRLAWLIIAA